MHLAHAIICDIADVYFPGNLDSISLKSIIIAAKTPVFPL